MLRAIGLSGDMGESKASCWALHLCELFRMNEHVREIQRAPYNINISLVIIACPHIFLYLVFHHELIILSEGLVMEIWEY